jgi:hypothetical protein
VNVIFPWEGHETSAHDLFANPQDNMIHVIQKNANIFFHSVRLGVSSYRCRGILCHVCNESKQDDKIFFKIYMQSNFY